MSLWRLYNCESCNQYVSAQVSKHLFAERIPFHYCLYGCSVLNDRRQRKLRVDEGILVYSVHFAYGYVYEDLYEYGCLV